MHRKFVEVILPLALPKELTYEVPEAFFHQVEKGSRVVVQLGKSRLFTALVKEISLEPPLHGTYKEILAVVDPLPVVLDSQFEFWKWMAGYYLCTLGEVMNAALPSGLKLTSESKVMKNEEVEIQWETLNDKEFLVMEALDLHETLSLDDISRILGIKSVQSLIRSLVEKDYIRVEQEMKEKFKPKKETYIRLHAGYDTEDALKTLFESLIRAPKQIEILTNYIRKSNRYVQKIEEISKKSLLENGLLADAPLRELIKKGVFEETKIEVGRIQTGTIGEGKMKLLSDTQEEALASIQESWKTKDVTLLHGITSSGKTEIYARLIAEEVEAGRQVLFLLPEIALTTQLVQRLQRIFPGHIGVYHSKFNDNERVEIWNKVLSFEPGKPGKFQVILGARSSIFLPFQHLGLIIVDEEHETSYKQHDPAPRYHARDAAIYLGMQHKAKVLLGSATPSFESYYNAQQGKYGFVSLKNRYGNVSLPEITIANIAKLQPQKATDVHFTLDLKNAISRTVEKREQVILFQNRRGFSLVTQCTQCAWIPHCKNCDISLTYHKAIDALKCHYCGYSIPVPKKCEACDSVALKNRGFGTEKVEEELETIFPELLVARMDLDSTRRKNAFEEILRDFSEGFIQVLVGTQMVSKGLDFENVSLVGVLNADNLFYFPEFRAHERAFQLLSQVSGRAGRRTRRGQVIIQTYSPEHPVLQRVMTYDYEGFYQQEMQEREQFQYPPFTRIISITFRHKDFQLVKQVAQEAVHLLNQRYKGWILGPEVPAVARIRNRFYFKAMMKIPKNHSLSAAKQALRDVESHFKANPATRPVDIIFDVDPF